MNAPRGQLNRLYTDASKIAEARLQMVGQYLDQIAELDEPPSGGTLTKAQFSLLLQHDEDFRDKLAEQAPFMTDKEKNKLQAKITELFPEDLPPSNTEITPRPF
jgi:hypothetical protein